MDFEFHFQLIRVILGYGLVTIALTAALAVIGVLYHEYRR